jgi:hypothetical protein
LALALSVVAAFAPVQSQLAASASVTSGTEQVHALSAVPTNHVVTVLARSIPIHLTIPSIGVSTALTQLGLLPGGAPQVPSSWYIAGWYKFGPTPGQLGSAVILGHVDSVAGPAVFDRLVDLKIGSRVVVKLTDRKTVTFQVIALRQYLKAKFPDKLVYGSRPYPALQLVTCGGVFDSKTGHYLSSIVVFTKKVGT